MSRAVFLACIIITTVVAFPKMASSKPEELGGANTVSFRDSQGSREAKSLLPPPDKPPPRPPKSGGPRIADRVAGAAPPVPALMYFPTGPCVQGGFTYIQRWGLDLGNQVTLPDCPGAAGSTKAAAPPPSPQDAAFQAWYWETKLPDPSLATSPPDGAITGLDLYLAIGGQQSMTLDVPALGYVVHLEVTSVYDVYWGDPRPDDSATGRAVTRNHPTQGGPYPSGDLRHQYIDRGSVTIEVAQKWTATWSAGGESGTIADRLATSATRTIPVQEIQAVVTG